MFIRTLAVLVAGTLVAGSALAAGVVPPDAIIGVLQGIDAVYAARVPTGTCAAAWLLILATRT